MILDVLHNQFCKVDEFKNYLNNIVRTEYNGVLGSYQYTGTDILPVIPNDAECSFSYWRQEGEYNTLKKDLGGCNYDYLLQGKFIFIYYSRDKKKEDVLFKLINQNLSAATSIDSNLSFEIKKHNTNKLDVLKNEYKNKTLDTFLLFNDCTYMSVQVDISYLAKESCVSECI